MDFFEEDDAPTSDEPAVGGRRSRTRPAAYESDGGDSGGGGGRPSQQQIRSRQLTFVGVSIVLFILLFLAVRGCLDARQERSFKNYVSDLSSLTVETEQLSDDFFKALSGESEGDISLQNQINGFRGTAQTQLDRAQNLDAPDELTPEQAEVVLSYELRRDGVETVADQLETALGRSGAKKATREISDQMSVFLASDVLFDRSRQGIEQELTDQEIVVEGGVPSGEFLPTGKNSPDWLDPATVEGALAGAGASGGGSNLANCEDDGLSHGLGLISTTAQPSGTVLTPGTPASIPADGAEFAIEVQNQGEAPESDIKVELSGDLSGNQTISTIEPQATETVTIRPNPAPASGDAASFTVTVATVCGEQVEENNTADYEVTFE